MQNITWAPSHLFRNLVCTASTVLPRLKTDLSKAAQDGIDLHKQSLIDDEFTPLEIQEYKNCLTSIQGELKQELKVSYAGINGVVDAVIVSDTELHILDLKTGYKPVDPVNNEQLQFYALALRNLYPHRLIYLHIYQRGLKTWQPTETDLNTFNHILLSQITRVENSQIESVTGEHCVNCPSAAFCNTLSKETNRITTYMKDDSYRLTLSDNELNDELINLKDAASLLKSRQIALEELAEHRMKHGVQFPNWMMKAGKAFREWIDKEHAVRNGWIETAVLSPAQVEKRGFKTEGLTVKKSGKYKLTFTKGGFNND